MARDLRIDGTTLVEWKNGSDVVIARITCNEGSTLTFSVRDPNTGVFKNYKMIGVNGAHGFPS